MPDLAFPHQPPGKPGKKIFSWLYQEFLPAMSVTVLGDSIILRLCPSFIVNK